MRIFQGEKMPINEDREVKNRINFVDYIGIVLSAKCLRLMR